METSGKRRTQGVQNFDETAERAKQAEQLYLEMDPRLGPSLALPILLPQLEHIKLGRTPWQQNIAGAIGLEMALATNETHRRKNILNTASKHFKVTAANTPKNNLALLIPVERLRMVVARMLTKSSNTDLYVRSMMSQLEHLMQAHSSVPANATLGYTSSLVGLINEQVVMLLTHAPHLGIYSFPSLTRQDQNSVTIDAKKYRWDVTVESTGETLPPGQYRLQVKSNPSKVEVDDYHEDIAVISATQHLDDNPYLNVRLKAAFAMLNGDSGVVETCRGRILHSLLNDPKVSHPSTHYLEVVT